MRSLALKLLLAFLAVSLTGTALVAVFAGRATAAEFGHFVFGQNQDFMVAQLAEYYRTRRSWAGVEGAMLPGEMPGLNGAEGIGTAGGLRGGMRGMMGRGGMVALADRNGQVVLAGIGHRQGETLSATELAQGAPVRVDGQTVGVLLAGRGGFGLNSAETAFVAQIRHVLLIASIVATAVALLLGVLLTRALTRPLRELTAATRAVAQGQLDQRVRVRSRDELGELAASFNQMSADLSRARDQRRQLTADIAHDLRTPLSVILGHTEALRDGVLPATPEALNLVHEEALRLNRLVEDLRTLSLAETGELSLVRRPVSPRTLLERAGAAQAPRAQQQNITLLIEVAPDLAEIEIDPDRMAQVLDNLLDNALRHTPAGGIVSLQASEHLATDCSLIADRCLLITVSDTGPGISPEHLPRVFDRFYRADKARRRVTGTGQEGGGSGLGLAIARSIVEAHGGHIRAESEPGAGARFVIELPGQGRGLRATSCSVTFPQSDHPLPPS